MQGEKEIDQFINERNEKAYNTVKTVFKDGDPISTSLIQRRCALGYNAATSVYDKLLEEGSIIAGEKQFSEGKYNVKK